MARSVSQRGRDLFQAAQEVSLSLDQQLLARLPFGAASKKTKEARMWTPEEDELLRAAIERHGEDWEAVASEVPGRNKLQCVQRWKKTLRPGLIKGPWKTEEDTLLLQVMSEEMEGDWQAIARRIPGRNAKQCKERWMLNLNPAINHGPWTPEEDAALIALHAEVGGKWSILAKRLTGRTEHAIKTRFLSLQKKAAKMRDWTVEEDRILLREYMAAPSLNGAAKTMKALPGRTKRQVQERWNFLRTHFVSIDDLATSSSRGGIALPDADLMNLIPYATPTNGIQQSSAASVRSSSTNNSEERPKTLARRQGSSNPNQPFRHVHKRLAKSESSSSASQRAAQLGSELLNQAYGSFNSAIMDVAFSSQQQQQPMMDSAFMSLPGQSEHFSSSSDDPFVTGLLKAGLRTSSTFGSSSQSSEKTRSLRPHASFSLPPLSPQPPEVVRQDSFARLASELEQLADDNSSRRSRDDEMFKAFSGMGAPELSDNGLRKFASGGGFDVDMFDPVSAFPPSSNSGHHSTSRMTM